MKNERKQLDALVLVNRDPQEYFEGKYPYIFGVNYIMKDLLCCHGTKKYEKNILCWYSNFLHVYSVN